MIVVGDNKNGPPFLSTFFPSLLPCFLQKCISLSHSPLVFGHATATEGEESARQPPFKQLASKHADRLPLRRRRRPHPFVVGHLDVHRGGGAVTVKAKHRDRISVPGANGRGRGGDGSTDRSALSSPGSAVCKAIPFQWPLPSLQLFIPSSTQMKRGRRNCPANYQPGVDRRPTIAALQNFNASMGRNSNGGFQIEPM